MKAIILIGIGSCIGGIARYLMAEYLQENVKTTFPIGTFCVNILGCFLIGIVVGLVDKSLISENTKVFLSMGILSGFTTFSAFSHQTVTLLKAGEFYHAFGYIACTIVLGLLATFFGIFLVQKISV